VEQHITRIAEVRPWDFLDAVCERDAGKALDLYHQMRDSSEVALVAMLVGRLRELVCAQALVRRGQPGDLARELGRQSWQVKNHLRWARAFGRGELAACLEACCACDSSLKSGADPQTAFTMLLLRVCGH
jgi:DNA polymerase-3 subunit delta